MDTERNPFKAITAEARRAQKILFFVCRETTTNKIILQIRAGSFAQSTIVLSSIQRPRDRQTIGVPNFALSAIGQPAGSDHQEKFFPLTHMDTERNPFKAITAEARRAQKILFFVCRETTTNKIILQIRAGSFAQSSSPDWAKKFFPQRTLRLCGEMSESSSAKIGEILRVKLFSMRI